jgi:hypothetical protein
MSPMRRLLLSVPGLSLLALVALSPRPAAACGNVIHQEDIIAAAVLRADNRLRDGNAKEAAEYVLHKFPDLKSTRRGRPLVARAQRILALAVVRTDGLLPVEAFAASTSEERRRNLEWAVSVLREVNEVTPNNPVLETALAEALSRLPEHQAEAFGLLGGLAEKNVLPTAQGYRALAALRRLLGDTEGEDAALKKAALLSKSPPPPEPIPASNHLRTGRRRDRFDM